MDLVRLAVIIYVVAYLLIDMEGIMELRKVRSSKQK